MQTSFINLITVENTLVQQLNVKSDPRLLSQSHSHLRNLIRAMEKYNPGDNRYKLALTTLSQYDRNGLDQLNALHNRQWESNAATNDYLDALRRFQETVGRAVSFIP